MDKKPFVITGMLQYLLRIGKLIPMLFRTPKMDRHWPRLYFVDGLNEARP